MKTQRKLYWGKTIASFFLVLFTMPLGHALMRVMEETMSQHAVNVSAFIMGAVGLAIAIWGVFVKGDTKQTLFGLFGGLLFWTGWVEFMYGYFAARFGVHYDLVGSGIVQTTTEYVNGIGVNHEMLINGVNVNDIPAAELKAMRGSRPEYLIMPASFGFWMMFIVLYLFGSKTGCHALNWLQKVFFGSKRDEIVPRNMSRHTAITTFMELNVMMWTMYLLLMFVYDPVFLGESHPVTIAVAIGCLVGSIFMFKYELKLGAWGPNIRMAISTVVIFWTTVEVFARNGLFTEFWVDPLGHVPEMVSILVTFLLLGALLIFLNRRKKDVAQVMAVLMALSAVSCDKDSKPENDETVKYGVDGKTPLPEAVDIGLEVDGKHVLWGSFNLGASKEWENGDYYAWGETEPYYGSLNPLSWKNGKEQGYDWASYSLAKGSYSTITKYCQAEEAGSWAGEGSVPDNLYELLPEDDAAQVKLGGNWKIPSKKMFEALFSLKENPDYVWEPWAETKNAKGETVHGLKITLKSTGKYIFFPATGYSQKTEVGKNAGQYGECWTSSLSTGLMDEFPPSPMEASHAFYVYYNSESSGRSLTVRYFGLTIRPVWVE